MKKLAVIAIAVLVMLVPATANGQTETLSFQDAAIYMSETLHRKFKGAWDARVEGSGGSGARRLSPTKVGCNLSWAVGDSYYRGKGSIRIFPRPALLLQLRHSPHKRVLR